MQTIQIPPEVIDALENAIINAIEDRIENDPDVADTYLRIIAQDGKFTVKVMYLEESNASSPNDDVALLNLMFDRKDNIGSGTEDWAPDPAAIRELAESYSEMIAVYLCPN